MRRHKILKKYDSKYQKKQKSKGFVSVVCDGRRLKKALVTLLCFFACVITAVSLINVPALNTIGVAATLMFAQKSDMPVFKSDKTLLFDIVSPFITIVPEKKEQELEKEPPPKVNIIEQSNKNVGIEIKNETDYDIDTNNILAGSVELSTSNPKVLIVHTHGSESYTSSETFQYTPSGNYRTQDNNFNVVRVGEELASHLRRQGVEVIHDKTINDFPSYNDSYNKTEKIIKKHLSADGDIAFVFDIHRDAVGDDDNIVKFVTDVDGKKTAQAMIVCGSDTNLQNPNWRRNLNLAVHIQNRFQNDYPGFMRPINLRKERFNMHLCTGSLLFEVGTNGNTLDEALRAAAILGDCIGQFISGLKAGNSN